MAMLPIVMAVQASVRTRPTAYTILRVMMARIVWCLGEGDVEVARGGVGGRTGVRDYCVANAGWAIHNACFRFGDDRMCRIHASTRATGRGARLRDAERGLEILENPGGPSRLQSGGAQVHAGSNM